MTLRSRAELTRSWSAYEAAMTEPSCGVIDREEAIHAWHPPSDAEFLSKSGGDALEVMCEHRGGTLPDMPEWLTEIAGITEEARWCLASLIAAVDDLGAVRNPGAVFRMALLIHEHDPVDHVEVLAELKRAGLIRGDARAVMVVERRAG